MGKENEGFFDSKAKVSFLWARKFVQLLWRYDCLEPQSFSKHFRLAVEAFSAGCSEGTESGPEYEDGKSYFKKRYRQH